MALDGGFLIVEDDEILARSVARTLRSRRRTHIASTVPEALAVLDSQIPLCGLLIDLQLGFDFTAGFDVLEAARRRSAPWLPAVITTTHLDRDLLQRANDLRAGYLPKPVEPTDIHAFATRAMAVERRASDRLVEILAAHVSSHNLTPEQADLLIAAVTGKPREQFQAEKSISDDALAKRVRTLIRKLGHETLDATALAVLRDAVDIDAVLSGQREEHGADLPAPPMCRGRRESD